MNKNISDFLEDKIDKLYISLQVTYDENQYNDEPLHSYISSICDDKNKFDSFCKALETTTKLKSLIIQNAFIPNEDKFFNSLSINKTLTELEISNSSNIDVSQLSNSIQNKNLRILKLNSTCLYKLNSLFELLKTNTTIKELELNGFNKHNMAYHDVNEIELKTLYEALKVNTTITKLSLNHNYINSIQPLCEALIFNHSLTEISLSSNIIPDISPLSKVLECNNTIEKINLYCNWIKSINSLYEPLQKNKCLQKIDLSYNNISDIDLDIFYDTLKCNNRLIKLNLEQNLCENYKNLHKNQIEKIIKLCKDKTIKLIL